jgi:hypothetical protein
MDKLNTLLEAYISGWVTFRGFHTWFTGFAWNAEDNLSERDLGLIRNIQATIDEFTGGYISEDRLKEAVSEATGLKPFLRVAKWVTLGDPLFAFSTHSRTEQREVFERRVAFG